MRPLPLTGLVALACAGAPQVTPTRGGEPATTEASAPPPVALEKPGPDGGAAADAAPLVEGPDSGPSAASDAAADAAPRVCAEAADYVPYVVDLGPSDNSAKMGNYTKSPSDEGRPIRATLSALSAPKALDAFNFAAYLPHYVAGAYQEASAARPGLRGTVRIRLILDATGKTTQVEVKAPGFPATFVDEVRERADTTYVVCPPLSAPATVTATITLQPRTLKSPRRP